MAATMSPLAALGCWRTTTQSLSQIAASIIDLSHRLGVEVTAEGVEDEQTASLLADMGCDHIQGFLYSKALPPADFVTWVRARAGIGLVEGNMGEG